MPVIVRQPQSQDESNELFEKREAAHQAEIERQRQSLRNIRAMVEARFGRPQQ